STRASGDAMLIQILPQKPDPRPGIIRDLIAKAIKVQELESKVAASERSTLRNSRGEPNHQYEAEAMHRQRIQVLRFEIESLIYEFHLEAAWQPDGGFIIRH
ncbi:MAG TPA: hypothetical protein VL306_03085, partial [Methylomirabilota bacterium]|nr:hypothetical protein [Methylomirabilota bacterium]